MGIFDQKYVNFEVKRYLVGKGGGVKLRKIYLARVQVSWEVRWISANAYQKVSELLSTFCYVMRHFQIELCHMKWWICHDTVWNCSFGLKGPLILDGTRTKSFLLLILSFKASNFLQKILFCYMIYLFTSLLGPFRAQRRDLWNCKVKRP